MKLTKIFFWLGLFLCLCLAVSAEDVLHLEGGGKVKGKIKKITPDKIVIVNKYGIAHVVLRDNVKKIVRGFNPEKEFQKRLKKIEDSGYPLAKDYYELAEFCEKYDKLEKYIDEMCRKTIELDPNHPQARARLGYIRHEGEWITKKNYKEKVLKGFVKVDGKWVRKSDLEKARREAKRKEEERLRRWAKWKKKQEELRKKHGGEIPSGDKSSGDPNSGLKRPKNDPKFSGSGFVSFKEMFKDTAQDVPWSQAHVYNSKYYKITSNTKPKYIKVYGIMLDKFFAKFRKVFRWNGKLNRRLPVHIYANQRQFMSNERKPRGVGGFYSFSGGSAKVVGYHGTFGRKGNTFTVLAHECTHQFEHLVMGTTSFTRTPIWIIEGLAVFFESAYYNPKTKKVIIGTIPEDRLATVKRMIRRGNYIRIRDLIRVPQSRFSAVHYAHAWSIIYWMVYTNRRNRRVFMQVWEKCKKGGMTEQEFRDIIKVDLDRWEEVWKKWVMQLQN